MCDCPLGVPESEQVLPPPLNLQDRVYLQVVSSHDRQLLYHCFKVLFRIVFSCLFVRRQEREGQQLRLFLLQLQVTATFLDFDDLVVHQHQARELVDEQVSGFGFFQRVPEQSKVNYGLVLGQGIGLPLRRGLSWQEPRTCYSAETRF